MEYLLATGNPISRSGLGLMQVTDYYKAFVCLMKSLRTPHSSILNVVAVTTESLSIDLFDSEFFSL